MLFKYKGLDQSGKKISSKIEANSIEEAKIKLKAKKIILKQLQENKDPQFFKNSLTYSKTINASILSEFSRDLSIYLNSGISIISAIKLINERYKKNKKLNTFFESISVFLDEGKSFYMALELQNSLKLPEFYKQSIKISENGGLLKTVLIELAQFLKEQERIKKQMVTAMAYPLFILTVSLFVVGFMLSFIVPKITDIFQQYNQALPSITIFVIALGDFFSAYSRLIFILLLLGILLFVFSYKKSKSFCFFVDKILLSIPFVGKLIELNELSRFSYMNSVLIRSGVPIVHSFKLASNIIKNSVIKELFFECSLKVVEGEKLSKTLNNSKIYKVESSFIHAIAIGEETSELSNILNNLANLYNENSKDKIAIFLALLEPTFMLFVGVVIGFIVIAMLLPIFSMNLG
ncbi:secretion system protein F [Halarcobacter ebronensis]|uniref:General secretion pathway protein F n=1 Tax=Halarcobacter ebronensis TaxID=1462615 RepID=A0A4Q0YF65_9BACT|nr:type II secretion system F family protein [Halarcobacter ebronensis]RXJ68314.1 secretion system protein F [Halarcobacter ebronensis]